MKKAIIRIVKGSEGYSLQVVDKDGSGYRYKGPKAWGNPYNTPTCEFIIDDIEDFYECLKQNSYEVQDENIK